MQQEIGKVTFLDIKAVYPYCVGMLAAQTNAAFWQFLVEKKDAFGTIESILKCLGILAGGWWAYWHFILKREKYPRGDLEHKIQYSRTSKDEWHVRVNLRVKNDSAVLMKILEGHTWVQQIRPHPEEAILEFKERNKDSEKALREVRWPLICEKLHNEEREVEPGEVDELAMDFFVSTFFEKILVYSFIENTAKPGRNLGWMTSTIIDFTQPNGAVIDQGQGQTQDKPRPNSARK